MNWIFDAMGDLRQYIPKLPKRRVKLTKTPKVTDEKIAQARKEVEQPIQPQVVPIQPIQPIQQPVQPVQPPLTQPQPVQPPQQPQAEQRVTPEQLLIEIYNKSVRMEDKLEILGELVKNMSELLRLSVQKKE